MFDLKSYIENVFLNDSLLLITFSSLIFVGFIVLSLKVFNFYVVKEYYPNSKIQPVSKKNGLFYITSAFKIMILVFIILVGYSVCKSVTPKVEVTEKNLFINQ